MNCFFLHNLAVKFNNLNRTRMDDVVDFPAYNTEHNKYAGAFHTAAGTACAGTAEHKQNKNHLTNLRPVQPVCSGISCGGNQRTNLEESISESLYPVRIKMADIDAYNKCGYKNYSEEKSQLITFENIFKSSC